MQVSIIVPLMSEQEEAATEVCPPLKRFEPIFIFAFYMQSFHSY